MRRHLSHVNLQQRLSNLCPSWCRIPFRWTMALGWVSVRRMNGLSNPLRVNGWWPSFTGWIGVMFFNKLQSAAEKIITSQILELDWMSRNPYGKFDNRLQQIDAFRHQPSGGIRPGTFRTGKCKGVPRGAMIEPSTNIFLNNLKISKDKIKNKR